MRTVIGFLLRAYSYLFHLILSLFLIGIASIAMSSGHPLDLGVLPWEGAKLTQYTLGLGILGLIFVFLAVTNILRFVFPFWTLVVFIMMFRGFFISPYHFAGEDQFRGAAWLTFGAFGAFLSSLAVFDRRRQRR